MKSPLNIVKGSLNQECAICPSLNLFINTKGERTLLNKKLI